MTDHETPIRRALGPAERLILLTDTDIDREGRFGRRWLAVTDKRVMVFPDEATSDRPEVEVPLKDLKSVAASHLVGQVALEAETDNRKVELLRCSNSLTEKFGKVAKSLTDARKRDEEPKFDLGEEEERHCPNCGRLLPEKGSFCPACLKKTEVLARFWSYMRPHSARLVVVTTCILLGVPLGLAPPYLTKILVDDVLDGSRNPKHLLTVVAVLAGVGLAATLLDILRGRLSAWLGSSIMHDVRFDLYQAIQRLSLRRHDKTQTGALLSRLTWDTQMLNFIFIEVGVYFFPNLLRLVGTCAILFWMNWWLALLVLVPTPVVVILTMYFYRLLSRLYHRLWQRRARMTALATDSISGVRVVKASSQELKEIQRFDGRSTELCYATAHAESVWATAWPVIAYATTIGAFLVWYFGGQGVLRGAVSVGTLIAFIGYLFMFYGPVQMLTQWSNFANRAFTAAQRLFEITDAEQEAYDDPDAQPLKDPQGGFRFEDVHFSYVKDRPVLKGMDVEVRPGEMIGLVGQSGVGKTTITNLICRFYDVDDGAIRLDGLDLRKIRLRDLRQHIGIVPQESFLFNGTVTENIAYAKPGATRDEVIQAAVIANAHGFIVRLPDGYDTRVGERGARLSGGEKQRIAIARAILQDPKVLILDEATSSVDTETEQLIQDALANLVKGRTTFAIAHRLSTLKNADRLLLIDDGKVAEFGSHGELLAKKGKYHKLVEMQSKLSAIKAING